LMSEEAQEGEHVVRRAGRAQGLQQAGEWAGVPKERTTYRIRAEIFSWS